MFGKEQKKYAKKPVRYITRIVVAVALFFIGWIAMGLYMLPKVFDSTIDYKKVLYGNPPETYYVEKRDVWDGEIAYRLYEPNGVFTQKLIGSTGQIYANGGFNPEDPDTTVTFSNPENSGDILFLYKTAANELTRIANNTVGQQKASNQELFSNSEYSFMYDKRLTITQENGTTFVRHTIPHQYVSPCNQTDNSKVLEELVDVDVSIKMYSKDLKGTLEENNGSFLLDNFFKNNTLIEETGFINPISIDGYNGFHVLAGSHGCGSHTYYVPVEGKTLVIKRYFGELTSLSPQSKELQKIPGVIQPEEENELFRRITQEFKIN